MTNRRAKIAAGATVLGLGALGGVALGTNHGVPVVTQKVAAAPGAAPVVTSASGAAVTPVNQPIEVGTSPSTRPPIITRSSGAGSGRLAGFDG